MEISVFVFLTLAAFVAGWVLGDSLRQLLDRIKRPINLTCKMLGHDMEGPYPVGEPGEVRFICLRCYRLMIIEASSGNTTIHRSAEFMDDPLVNLLRKAKSHERH